jgi:hypothetical protein
MTFASRLIAVTGLLGVVLAAEGCASSSDRPSDEADRFREALPLEEDVKLAVPSNGAAGGTTTKSAGLHIATDGAGGSATSYQFTRTITGAVDFTTAVILGGVWAIVHSPPSSLEAKKAVWGPGSGNALDPAQWRFTVTEVGDKEYDYVLEGQLKAGGAWLPVLDGHGYGKERAEHRQGFFRANNDNYRSLDPQNGHDEGTTKITFDLTKLPATIDVELRPSPEKGSLDIKVTHESGGAGRVSITGTGDIDESKATKLENIEMLSRWATTGAGRSQWTFSGGDLPIASVTANECWSTSFARVYYKDTVNYQPATGEESTCAFGANDL